MRIVVKDADFSAVSIGKIEKDLSFSYTTDAQLREIPWLNVIDKTAAFSWYDGHNVSDATIYLAGSSSGSYTTMVAGTRIVTDYIEVSQGMTISGKFQNTDTVPTILCFGENKNPLGPSSTYCDWINSETSFTFTVPAGVKYIKLQVSHVRGDKGYYFTGTMPSV